MHGSITLGGQVLMGGDVAPDKYEAPKGFSLSLQINTPRRSMTIPNRSAQTADTVRTATQWSIHMHSWRLLHNVVAADPEAYVPGSSPEGP